MITWMKTVAFALSVSFCFAGNGAGAATVSCNVDTLIDKWLEKHTAIRTLSETYPDVLRKLKAQPGTPGFDNDYKPEHFGGEAAKNAFTQLMVSSDGLLDTAVKRAALTDKPPCYVCLLLVTYRTATEVTSACTRLLKAVGENNDLSDLSPFNCDQVKDFTKTDMEATSLNDDFWDKASRLQANLEDDLKTAPVRDQRRSIIKLNDHLQKFVDFRKDNPPGAGDANQLKTDIATVGGSCTSGGRALTLRRF